MRSRFNRWLKFGAGMPAALGRISIDNAAVNAVVQGLHISGGAVGICHRVYLRAILERKITDGSDHVF